MFGSVVSLSLLQPLDRWSLNLIGSPKERFTVGLTRRRLVAPRASARRAFARFFLCAFSLRFVVCVHFSASLVLIRVCVACSCVLGAFRRLALALPRLALAEPLSFVFFLLLLSALHPFFSIPFPNLLFSFPAPFPFRGLRSPPPRFSLAFLSLF